MPEDEPTMLASFGLSLEEVLIFEEAVRDTTFSDRAKLSREIVISRNSQSEKYIAEKLSECSEIWSSSGVTFRILESQRWLEERNQNPSASYFESWEEYLLKYFKHPILLRNTLFFIIHHAAIDAQTKFCLDCCPAPSREETLTGKLLAHFESSLTSWSKIAAAYLGRSDATIELSTIDLQVGRLEAKTGGDFAIILEIEDTFTSEADRESSIQALLPKPRGEIIVPIVFQAKRYALLEADISQHHDENGWQYDILRGNECSSVYIFYNNDTVRVDRPALPMVKSAEDCLHPLTQKKTAVFDKAVDFSTYILRAIGCRSEVKPANSREEALEMIYTNIDEGRLNTVSVVSSKPGAGPEYSELLKQFRSQRLNPDKESGIDHGPQF